MADLNRVYLMGNLTKDPEIRYTSSGKPVGDLRMAITTKFKESEDTCFVSVTVWDRQAETCGEYLHKGSPVFVEGRLKLDEWEKDGQKRSRLTVVASRVQFLGSARGGEGGGPERETRSARRNAGDQQDETADGPADGAAGAGAEAMADDDNLPF